MIQLALGDDVRWPLRPGQWLAVALSAMAFPLFAIGLAMAPSLRDPWLVLLPASAAILGQAWHQASIDRPKGLPRMAALFAGGALWDGLPRRRVSIYAALGGLGVAGLFAAMAIWGLWAVLAYWVATATAIVALLVLERRRTR
jgi:hypothetical protein